MDIQKAFKSTARKYDLFSPGDRILVAVSGGPDSIALLYLLNSLKEEFGLSLCVAHLDHELRKEAKDDLLFVKKTAAGLDLPFISDSINIKRLARQGSVEEVAREARLRFLFKAAKKFHADKIALGHTKDDQAETVLMRVLRGTGLYGLRGILPRREILGFTVIRPLIHIERTAIENYLKKIKVKPRQDKTNFEDIYFRNKIRNNLMPMLKNYNRNIKDVLSDMAENIGFDYDYLFQVASRALSDAGLRTEKTKLKIDLMKIQKFHPAIQRLIIRVAINDIAGSTRKLNFQHWKEIEDLIFKRPAKSIVNLPNHLNVKKEKNQIIISSRKT
ncbi:MAG: tRNA lysidine(34) synthetase TilS [Candidatus Omnitrophica bacterium]|nr:tRNA lysidine(34) synthetase TilS [Candidatus Omnitrophota bacterium]HOX54157.1 tRNA lysidine(34) synthetase TilS [Candidatus Omnitrophota bacterium]